MKSGPPVSPEAQGRQDYGRSLKGPRLAKLYLLFAAPTSLEAVPKLFFGR